VTASDLLESECASVVDPAEAEIVAAKIIRLLALESDFAQQVIHALDSSAYGLWGSTNPWFDLWKEHSLKYFDVSEADKILSEYIKSPTSEQNLFLAQSYCAVLLEWLLQSLLDDDEGRSPVYSGSLFGWLDRISLPIPIELDALLSRYPWKNAGTAPAKVKHFSDFLARLYQEIMPPSLRHLLGEYYTPSWLIDYSIGHAQKRLDDPAKTHFIITDPATGSGGFLAHYSAILASTIKGVEIHLNGFDINPVAILFSIANLTMASNLLKECCEKISFEIHLSDSVVDPVVNIDTPLFGPETGYQVNVLGVPVFSDVEYDGAVQGILNSRTLSSDDEQLFYHSLKNYIDDSFYATKSLSSDVIAGNPPWISWDGLNPSYRERVAPQWSSSALFTSKGWKAKVAAGKTDFSSLFVYRSAERYAAPGATMVFVLPISLFQSRLSGQGFRQFKTSGGRRFPLVGLDDFSSLKVFPDAVNRTSVGVFSVDGNTDFPIPYICWSRSKNEPRTHEDLLGGPINPSDETSPIVKFDKGSDSLDLKVGKSEYRARGGVNTGGANTILQLNLLADKGEFATIQNTGKSRRSCSKVITAEVESDVVFPLLCGTDMKKWKATPSKSILLVYDPKQPKKAIPETIAKKLYPKALDFLYEFKDSLGSRKEYFRWGCSGPFYEVYRIGPYTFSPIKVVWQHTGYKKSLNIAVVDDTGKKVTIPDQKAIMIPCDSLEEAHYICAYMGSDVVASLLNRYLGTDASTHIMDYISLHKFDGLNENHVELSELSLNAHRMVTLGESTIEIEDCINKIVGKLLVA
jgi:hypothetical protein